MPRPHSRFTVVFIALSTLLCAHALPAQASEHQSTQSAGDVQPQADLVAPSDWVLGAQLELAMGDFLAVRQGLVIPDGVPSLGVTFSGHRRLGGVDLGVQLMHHAGGDGTALVESVDVDTARIRVTVGTQLAAQAKFRWRFAEAGWGGMYLALSPGLSVILNAPSLRAAFDPSLTDTTARAELSPMILGGCLRTGLGALIRLSLGLALEVSLSSTVTLASMTLGGDELSYLRVFAGVGFGLEWDV